jgi:hypothetical protein
MLSKSYHQLKVYGRIVEILGTIGREGRIVLARNQLKPSTATPKHVTAARTEYPNFQQIGLAEHAKLIIYLTNVEGYL